jgi:hypothetical protein
MFRQATRNQSKLRMTIDGPAGSGKSYTALRFAHILRDALQPGGKIAAIDTERGSLSLYVGEQPDGYPWAFDVMELTSFSPEKYTEAISLAGRMGYTVLIVDSLSHAWEGAGGALEIKDRVSSAGKGNDWTAWRSVTPLHNRLVDALLQSPCHVITTMRSRQEYVQEVNEHGRTVIRRVGLAPIQRPGVEFEFSLVCDMDWSHIMTVSKSRCNAVTDMKVEKPGPGFMQLITDWLTNGETQTAAPEPVFMPAQPESAQAISLDDLTEKYDLELILSANGGRIPETQEEIKLTNDLLALTYHSQEV